MALMRTKSCCCGCSLNFGVQLMAYILLGLSSGALYCSTTLTGRKESFEILFAELFVVGSCALTIYACKKNQRFLLLPFIAIVIAIFATALMLSLSLALAVLGMHSRALNSYSILTFMRRLKPEYDSAFIRYGTKSVMWSTIEPLIVLMLIICVPITLIFLHFVKVVCSLFAQMENPIAFQKRNTIFIILDA